MVEPPNKKLKLEQENTTLLLNNIEVKRIKPPKDFLLFTDANYETLNKLFEIYVEFDNLWKSKKFDTKRNLELCALRHCILNILDIEYNVYNLKISTRISVAYSLMSKYFKKECKQEIDEKIIKGILSIPRTISYKKKILDDMKKSLQEKQKEFIKLFEEIRSFLKFQLILKKEINTKN